MALEPGFNSATQVDWELACEREMVIRPLAQAVRLESWQVADAANAIGLGRSATYRLIALFKRRPKTSTLLPAKSGRRHSTRWLDPRVEAIVEQTIQKFYLSPERPGVIALLREISRVCAEQQLKAPTYRTVRRRLGALDIEAVTRSRLGAKTARQLYQPVQRSPFDDLLPLELVQIDHTQLDVIVVDESERRPIGRPWMTLAIDVASRVVSGFYVSLDPPASISVALALTQSVLPKDLWLADRRLELSWPVAGIPQTLHLDNAPEFDSKALQRGAQEYGIALQYRPPRQPRFGGPHRAADGRGPFITGNYIF